MGGESHQAIADLMGKAPASIRGILNRSHVKTALVDYRDIINDETLDILRSSERDVTVNHNVYHQVRDLFTDEDGQIRLEGGR
jgi:hypothetical protein